MDTILIAHINKKLDDIYGRLITGESIFKVSWTTNLTEKRKSIFTDFWGEVPIRTVEEVREVLKYPFAQDRYVLERIQVISEQARELGLRTDSNYSYEEVYTFQDKMGQFLPLNWEKVEQALYLFFVFYLQKTPKERVDMRMELLAKREIEAKRKNKELLGEGRSPFFFVLE